MMTHKMRRDLRKQGFSKEEIKQMTPDEAWKHLGGMPDSTDNDNEGESQLLQNAVAYARLGLRVIPLHTPINGGGG